MTDWDTAYRFCMKFGKVLQGKCNYKIIRKLLQNDIQKVQEWYADNVLTDDAADTFLERKNISFCNFLCNMKIIMRNDHQ